MYKNRPDSSECKLSFSKESIDFDLFFDIASYLAEKIYYTSLKFVVFFYFSLNNSLAKMKFVSYKINFYIYRNIMCIVLLNLSFHEKKKI